jgi:hypothetical protein
MLNLIDQLCETIRPKAKKVSTPLQVVPASIPLHGKNFWGQPKPLSSYNWLTMPLAYAIWSIMIGNGK